MALDMNPNANMTAPQQPQGQTPQNFNNGTAPGGVAAMIKAIMDGNDAYKQQQASMPPALSAGSSVPGAMGPTSVGGPQGPSPLAGGLGSSPMQPPAPPAFGVGASPVSMDPVSAALMSPIPGM